MTAAYEPPRDIEIIIEQDEPLTAKFMTAPNALFRGERDVDLNYDFRDYTLRERCILAALLSMKSGFRCNRRRIAKLAPELGTDALDTVLVGLRLKGNLRIVQDNGGGGRFAYRWGVALRARADWAEAETAALKERSRRATKARPAISAGQPMPGLSGHGDEPTPEDGQNTTMGATPHPGEPGMADPRVDEPSVVDPGALRRTTVEEDQQLKKTDQVVEDQLGESDPPDPLGPQAPTTSALGTDNPQQSDEPGSRPLQADRDHRPRKRAQETGPAPVDEVEARLLADGGLDPVEARRLAKANAVPRRRQGASRSSGGTDGTRSPAEPVADLSDGFPDVNSAYSGTAGGGSSGRRPEMAGTRLAS